MDDDKKDGATPDASISKLTEDDMPQSPFAKFPGELTLGKTVMDCYVLDTGDRVISTRATVKAMTGIDAGNLGDYLSVQALKGYVDKDQVLAGMIEFHIPGTQFKGRGIKAEDVIAMLQGYVAAYADGKLNTDRQRENAMNCAIMLSSCAKLGLIALIDEATGYQYVREQDALQVKLRAFIAEELRDWEKTFPDELWEQFGRLTKWKGSLHSRPKWWGKLVLELVYDALDPDIAEHLKTHKPPPKHGSNYHQWFTQDVGLKALLSHIYQIIGIAKTCNDMRELRDKVGHFYGKEMLQISLFVPALPPKAKK